MKFLLTSLALFASTLLLAPAADRPAADQTQGPQAVKSKQKITTFLWYDDDAEEAVRFYCSIFKNSKVLEESRWGEGGPVPKGTLMTARFQLEGQEFVALNGGPMFQFNEAISLLVDCENQQEVDTLWAKLTADGGEESQCGWLKDKYGLSWQIIPTALMGMITDKDPAKAGRATQAMLQMRKIDIARIKQAYDGR